MSKQHKEEVRKLLELFGVKIPKQQELIQEICTLNRRIEIQTAVQKVMLQKQQALDPTNLPNSNLPNPCLTCKTREISGRICDGCPHDK